MFCPKCGTKIPEDSTVCPNCKLDYSSIINARENRNNSDAAANVTTDNSTSNSFNDTLHDTNGGEPSFVSPKSSDRSSEEKPYDLETALVKADQICNEAYPFMEKASNMRANADEKAVKSRKIFKIISVVIGLLSIDAMGNLAANTGADPSMAFLIVIMGILLAVALYKLVFLKTVVDFGVKSEYETAANEEQKGTDILNANADALSVMPSDYWYPLATDYVLKMIRSGRADSVNEALLMFDEQLHRWRMEDSSASILAQQQAQTDALRGIRKSNAVNATANVVNAAANITRLFK